MLIEEIADKTGELALSSSIVESSTSSTPAAAAASTFKSRDSNFKKLDGKEMSNTLLPPVALSNSLLFD